MAGRSGCDIVTKLKKTYRIKDKIPETTNFPIFEAFILMTGSIYAR